MGRFEPAEALYRRGMERDASLQQDLIACQIGGLKGSGCCVEEHTFGGQMARDLTAVQSCSATVVAAFPACCGAPQLSPLPTCPPACSGSQGAGGAGGAGGKRGGACPSAG